MRTPTPLPDLIRLIDAYEAGDSSVYPQLAYALTNAARDSERLSVYLRHGRAYASHHGVLLVRSVVVLENEAITANPEGMT